MQGNSFGKVQTLYTTEAAYQAPKKQVGILGGNFNPVHYTHLVMGEEVGQALGLDKVRRMSMKKRRSRLLTDWQCYS